MKTCPRGHFCPLGTVTPFKCGTTSACPDGADREFVMDGFIGILIIDTILLSLLLHPVRDFLVSKLRRFLRPREAKTFEPSIELERAEERAEYGNKLPSFGQPAESNPSKDTDGPTSETLRQFVASVSRCVGSRDVGLSFRFEDLSFTLDHGTTIVSPQSGHIKKGTFWGVMGASGAGKSELPVA